MRKVLFFLGLLVITADISAQIYEWRGPERLGIYPDQPLADTWPDEGPKLIASYSEAGTGYGSPSITPEGIYIAGMKDSIGYISKYQHNGTKVWERAYGLEFTYKYLGSRGTSTIEDNRLYYSGTYGNAVCLNTKDGSVIWQKNIFEIYGGEPIKWGYTESPLLYKNLIILTPGGSEHTMVALDKISGEEVWTMSHEEGINAYCSPSIIEHNGTVLAMVNLNNNLILFYPESGKVYLSHPLNSRRGNHAIAPLYLNGKIYYSSGYGEGSAMFKINDTNRQLDTLWTNDDLDCKMSGLIEYKGIIYGTSDSKKQWVGLSAATGKTVFTSREIKPGSFVMADEKFFLFSDIGEVALAVPGDEGFSIVSKFNIPVETVKMSFAHPVIFNKTLYLRYDDQLWAYSIE